MIDLTAHLPLCELIQLCSVLSFFSGEHNEFFLVYSLMFLFVSSQDTLIVWSEADNFDLALSFQEKAGCDEIWEKICQVKTCKDKFSTLFEVICLLRRSTLVTFQHQ